MAQMAVLVDVSRCTGCRGCQVACKQWNKNPASETCFTGTYENPPDLEWNTFTRVAFREIEESGKLAWLFRKDQCRHCVDPACKGACPVEGAIVKHENGAVTVDQDKCVGGKDGKCSFECADACPFSIPRFLPAAPKKMRKCTFCIDRQQMDPKMKPACVSACLSGALFFGTREEVLAEGERRLALLKQAYPDASLHLKDDVTWIYLLAYAPASYGISFNPEKASRKVAVV
jgi:formate dehydrogenase iron-sulfur subunit